jgi:hypothetical protein
MITITNTNGVDVFYMDTTKFTKDHFNQMLPYVEASMMRNFVTANLETHHRSQPRLPEITKILGQFSYKKTFQLLEEKHLLNQRLRNLLTEVNISETTGASKESKDLVSTYLSQSYEAVRELYYTYVNEAEILVSVQRKNVLRPSFDIDASTVLEIMKKVAKALIFRAESYTCPPTVMHVVRILQANPDQLKDKKYKVDYPVYCKLTTKGRRAFCNIGKYGYLMSILEQIGYILRFNITYCKTGIIVKCDKKLGKYIPRITNAFEILSELPDEHKNIDGKIRKSRKMRSEKRKRIHTTYRKSIKIV